MPKINRIDSFIIENLFLPKVVTIDNPGIIISQVSSVYMKNSQKRRTILSFEDIISNLIAFTEKKLGKQEAKTLFYEIGKDIGARYFMMKNGKRPPRFLVPYILDYALKAMKGAGMSMASEFEFDIDKKFLKLSGDNNIICRKTGNGEIFAGAISSVFSALMGENIEAKKISCCYDGKKCEIICSKDFKFVYNPKPDIEDYRKYEKLNFPEKIQDIKKDFSFSDLIKFKKIMIQKEGKIELSGFAMMPSEIGWYGIIQDKFLKNNLKKLFEDSVSKGAGIVASSILKGIDTTEKKMDYLKKLICCFGWGFPYMAKEKNILSFKFVFAPFSRYGFFYQACELKGYLEVIYRKKIRITKIKEDIYSRTILVNYAL